MSTFHGLEMAKQALFAQQAALYTTGHNISNANTEGYSRQRVNFQTTSPYPSASRNRPQIPGQMGTGVEIGSVQRVRNEFLDIQFRGENSKSGYWETKADALSRMEGLMNEPSESGLSKTMDKFWQSLQDLAVNPKNSGARSVVLQRGKAVAETFNYMSKSLNSIRGDLKLQINATVDDANSLLKQIDAINEQVSKIEPHGYLPNDLYDERDRLIDELSTIVNINVKYDSTGKSSKEIAGGVATITVLDDDGKPLLDNDGLPITLVDGENGGFNKLKVNYDTDDEENRNAVSSITVGDKELSIIDTSGSLKGLVEAYGHTFSGGLTGEYTEMLSKLDRMAKAFVDQFNEVHSGGIGIDEASSTGLNFFEVIDDEFGAAGSIKIEIDDPDKIAASTDDTDGNGENALLLSDVFDTDLDDLGGASVKSFYESLIGELGVQAQEANRMASNTGILRSQVAEQRMSVSAVSLDEEMTNMIKFQHAYNAAARSMTATDELLDRIINGMGLVGR